MPDAEILTVVVVNFNGARYLPACLGALRRQTLPRRRYEVVLVDNGSTDDSIALVRQRFPEVRVVAAGANLGFAAGNNFGAAAGQWREAGVPDVPRAWLITTARRKAIDRSRRSARFQEKLEQYASGAAWAVEQPDPFAGEIPDDRLRLIFT